MVREVSSICLVQHLHMRTEAVGNHYCAGVIDTGAMAPVTSPCRSGYIGGLACHYGGENERSCGVTNTSILWPGLLAIGLPKSCTSVPMLVRHSGHSGAPAPVRDRAGDSEHGAGLVHGECTFAFACPGRENLTTAHGRAVRVLLVMVGLSAWATRMVCMRSARM